MAFNSYYYRNADEAIKRAVWNKGRAINGLDPDSWRADPCGAYMQYAQHGNRDSQYGWEIDHVIPTALGGSDTLSNLQPLHWENNAAKGDSIHWSCAKR